jgi:hypothetical protein
LTMLSTTGSAFALGYTRAFNEALEQASAEAAVQLRVWPR